MAIYFPAGKRSAAEREVNKQAMQLSDASMASSGTNVSTSIGS